ncbi:hypothetical protein [Vibrio rotiferianus]|uniref:hypothetical protein n=1 Tax=Vibrio rotiferianus TaxID=190895 RepID=UPI002893A384|nr:hypothetical protein THOB06_150022 [Vibrio rotiferianus]
MPMKFINSSIEKHFENCEYMEEVNRTIDMTDEDSSNSHPDFEPSYGGLIAVVVDLIVSRGYLVTDISK